jgi:hypothetical protein
MSAPGKEPSQHRPRRYSKADSIGIPKAVRTFLENFDGDYMIESIDASTVSQEHFVPPNFLRGENGPTNGKQKPTEQHNNSIDHAS